MLENWVGYYFLQTRYLMSKNPSIMTRPKIHQLQGLINRDRKCFVWQRCLSLCCNQAYCSWTCTDFADILLNKTCTNFYKNFTTQTSTLCLILHIMIRIYSMLKCWNTSAPPILMKSQFSLIHRTVWME